VDFADLNAFITASSKSFGRKYVGAITFPGLQDSLAPLSGKVASLVI
jgi:hypothetical protein